MSENSDEPPVLLNFWGKRATSHVWNYFGFEADEKGRYKDPKKCICRICYHAIKYFGNTTNMAHHLSTHNGFIPPTSTSTASSPKVEVIEPIFINDDSYEPPEKVSRDGLIVVEFWSKTKRSIVWEYFGFYASADGEYVDKSETVCKLCHTCLKYNGNTTNLANHLYRYHGVEGILTSHDPNLVLASDETTEKVNQILQAATAMQNKSGKEIGESSSSSKTSYMGNTRSSPSLDAPPGVFKNLGSNSDHVTTTTNELGFNNKRKAFPIALGTLEGVGITLDRLTTITAAIGQYLLEEKLPISHVSSSGFIRFVQRLDNLYKMPSPEFFKGSTFQKLTDEINRQMTDLKKAERHVLTGYKWSAQAKNSSGSQHEYTTFIVNYINEDYVQKNFTIKTIEGELTQDEVADLTEIWGLKNIVVVGTSYKYHLESDVIVHPCFSATIKSALWKCFQLGPILSKLMDCARECAQNPIVILDKVLGEFVLNLSVGHGVQGNPWLVFDMLNHYQSITHEGGSDIQGMINILRSFKTAQDMLTVTAKGSTAALILPTLYKLIKKEFALTDTDNDIIKAVKSSLVQTLTDVYLQKDSSCYKLLMVATIVDPRLKSLDWMDKEEKEYCYELLNKEALQAMCNSEKLLRIKPEPGEGGPKTGEACSHNSVEEGSSDLSFLDDVLSESKNDALGLSPEEEVEKEMQHYRGEQNVKGGTSGLVWWSTRSEAYPILSMVARKYLCIPATSADTNRVLQYPMFGTKTQPSIDEINQLMFVHNNKECTTLS